MIGELLGAHGERLLGIIERRLSAPLRARMDAEDILQLTFLNAEREFDQSRRPPGAEFVWLYGVVMDRIKAEWRRATRQKRDARLDLALPDSSSVGLALAASGSSRSSHLSREEQAQRVRATLARMRQEDGDLLVVHFIDRLSFRETAEALDINEDAAAVRCHRAAKMFRACWDEPSGR